MEGYDFFDGGGGDWGGGGGGYFTPMDNPQATTNAGGLLGDLTSIFGGSSGGVSIQLPSNSGPSVSQTLTQIVNSGEAALRANLARFQAQQAGATDALAAGWSILNDVIARITRYGAEGIKAAAERDRRVNPSQLRWDWIAYYLDTISGGPSVLQPLPGAGGATPIGTIPPVGASTTSSMWLVVAAIVAIFLFRGGLR